MKLQIKYLIFPVIAILILVGCKSEQKADIIISNINVIDVVQGKLINSQDVVISGDQIIDILSHDEQEYQAKELINGEGKYMIPGLWDMHVHTGNADIFFPLYIANGITGVRDMGGGMERSTGGLSVKFHKLSLWRNEIIQGKRLGPEMLLAGAMIDGSPPVWPGSIIVTDSSSIWQAVQSQKKLGVDFIKVYHNLTLEQLYEVAKACETHNIQFAGHIPFGSPPFEALTRASKLGQRSLEHLVRVPAAIQKGSLPYNSATKIAYIYRDIMEMIDPNKELNLFNTFIENDTWLTTTVSIWWGFGQLDQGLETDHDRWLDYVPTHIRSEWNPANDIRFSEPTPNDLEAFRGAALGLARLAKRMHDSGINIMAGSDSANPMVVPGYGLQKELQLLVKGGFSNAEALRLATMNPAKFMGRNDIGIIALESQADLVILNKNPLKDISNISSIDGLLLKGEYLNREKLDELLDQAKRLVDQR
jgi:hypothetical protein